MRLGRFGAWAGCSWNSGGGRRGYLGKAVCLQRASKSETPTQSREGMVNQGTMWWRRKQQLAGFRNCVLKSFNHVKRHVSSARNFPDRCDLITANMMWYILVTWCKNIEEYCLLWGLPMNLSVSSFMFLVTCISATSTTPGIFYDLPAT